jgi:hypothetical protein
MARLDARFGAPELREQLGCDHDCPFEGHGKRFKIECTKYGDLMWWPNAPEIAVEVKLRHIAGCRTAAQASKLITEYERKYGTGCVRRGKLEGGKIRVVCLDPVSGPCARLRLVIAQATRRASRVLCSRDVRGTMDGDAHLAR